MNLIKIIIIIFLFISCKKEPDKIIVSGTINNYIADADVSGVSIVLYGKKIESGTYNGSFTKLISANTDNTGKYNFEIDKENISEYKITLSKYGYFSTEEIFYSKDFIKNKISKNFTIYPSANITIKVKNTSPINNNDYFKYTIVSGYYNAVECCSKTAEFFGIDVVEEITCKVIGNQNVTFDWIKAKDGNTYIGSQTIYCYSDQDNLIELNY